MIQRPICGQPQRAAIYLCRQSPAGLYSRSQCITVEACDYAKGEVSEIFRQYLTPSDAGGFDLPDGLNRAMKCWKFSEIVAQPPTEFNEYIWVNKKNIKK